MSRTNRAPAPEGVYAALVTPRRNGGSEADTSRMLDYMGKLEAAHVSGFVLFGSTGEFIHFSPDERMRLATMAMRRSRVPVLVNVSYSDLAGVMALSENAIGLGAAGLLVMPPYFYRYDEGTIQAFFEAVSKLIGTQTRLYLYNLPQHSNPIPVPAALHLLRSGGYAGIKDSSGDWSLFEQLLALQRDVPFRLLVGSERIYLAARSGGAHGIVSGVAAGLPELIVALDAAVTGQEESRAARLNVRLFQYLGWLEKFPATFLIRQTAALRGWVDGGTALPVSPEQQTELDRFRAWFPDWHNTVLGEIAGQLR